MMLAKTLVGMLMFAAIAQNQSSELAPQPAPPFHIQAHRGAGLKFPENTLESFMMSWSKQITPEADLQTTKDGTIVCFHDSNLRRLVSNLPTEMKNTSIGHLTVQELEALEVGAFRGEQFRGQRVPTLSKVFSAMHKRPDRLLYLDIKKVVLDQLVALVREFDVESQVIFATSSHKLIINWKKRLPSSQTLLWNGGSEGALVKKMNSVRKTSFEGITHLQIHVRPGNLDSEKPFTPSVRFLETIRDELKSRGILFQVFPPKCADRRAYVSLLELGVESFASDYPAVTLEAVREFRESRQK